MGEGKKVSAVIIYGDNGTGKSFLLDAICENDALFTKIITCTTRKPRIKSDGKQEVDGVDYFFKSEDSFLASKMIEYSKLKNKDGSFSYYGTPLSEVERAHSQMKVMVLILDPNGVSEIVHAKQKGGNCCGYEIEPTLIHLDIPKNLVFRELLKEYNKRAAINRISRGNIRDEIINKKLDTQADFTSKTYLDNKSIIHRIKDKLRIDINTNKMWVSNTHSRKPLPAKQFSGY